jgi:hypothetical protein
MIKLLAIIFFSAQTLLAQSQNNKPKSDSINRHANKDDREEKIMGKLLRLPEIKERTRFIDSLTKHEHGISFRTMEKPNSHDNYYLIQAGFDRPDRFEIYYNFYIYLPKMNIKILEPVSNKLYSLTEWRKKFEHH